jgi:hypothetical protein
MELRLNISLMLDNIKQQKTKYSKNKPQQMSFI